MKYGFLIIGMILIVFLSGCSGHDYIVIKKNTTTTIYNSSVTNITNNYENNFTIYINTTTNLTNNITNNITIENNITNNYNTENNITNNITTENNITNNITIENNITIQNNYTTATVTMINLTTNTYNGSLSNGTNTGYKAGNFICNATFTDTHLCNEFEIIYYVQMNNITYLDGQDAWDITGAPKYIPASVPVNDCLAFTYDNTVSYLGNYYHFNKTTGGDARAINCATRLSLACCK